MPVELHQTALLTDLYQLNMMQSYLEQGKTDGAVFELFFRKLPPQRSFLMAAGLDQALAFLESLQFREPELDWLSRSGRFSRDFIDYLAGFRFTGEVHAMLEGRVFFADEPILRVTAPLPEAQLVETRLMNLIHFETVIASKAARMVIAAPGKLLVDFGLRRAHGSEAGLLAARASYIAGFAGTATILAELEFGIPTYGTMAHSFIQAFDNEAEAFESFARLRPQNPTLLIDTYDTERGAQKVVALASRLGSKGIAIRAVRLDSGDLLDLSCKVRAILDAAGYQDIQIFASGGLDEWKLRHLLQAGAPIDGFGIGTSLTTSSDAPALDCAYKLQEYAGLPRRKRSVGKATWPGRKQVYRRYDADGRMAGDLLTLESEAAAGEALILPVMHAGRRLRSSLDLAEARMRATQDLSRLAPALRPLEPAQAYPVEVAPVVVDLAAAVDRRLTD
jgi:nicotinate phosphoribosyltransferase